jgi:hypothetical protein
MRRVLLGATVVTALVHGRVVVFAACWPLIRRWHPEQFDAAAILAGIGLVIAEEVS